MMILCAVLLAAALVSAQTDPATQTANTWAFQYRKAAVGDVTHPYENGFVWDYKNQIGVVFGGHLGVTHNMNEDIIPEINNTNMTYVFSFDDNRFHKARPAERPPKRCGVKTVYDEGWAHTLAFCGMYHNYFNGYLEPGLRFDGLVTEAPEYEMDYPLSPWAFDGATRQWYALRPLAVEGLPKGKGYFHGFGTGLAFAKEYGLVLVCPTNYNRVYAFCPYFNQWTLLPLNASDPAYPAQADAIPAVYDLKQRKMLYVYPGANTWVYDVGTKSWTRLASAGSPASSGGGWNRPYPCATYDSRNGVAIYLTADGSQTWAMPSGGAWTRLNPTGAPASGGSYAQGLVYDPVRNASIVYAAAGDEVWTYKYGNGIANRPGPVSNVSGETSENSITLTWSAPASGAAKYYVYRCEWEDNKTVSSGIIPGAYTLMDSTSDTAYTDADTAILKKAGVFHSYFISALSAQGIESDPSDPVFTIPRVPMGLTVTPLSTQEVLLRWKPKPEADIAGYHVYRTRHFYPKHNHMKANRLNTALITGAPMFTDNAITLYPTTGTFVDTYFYKPPDMGTLDSIVMYVVTAVNRLGKESGFSPWALTHPDGVTNMWTDTVNKVIHFSPPRCGNISKYQVYRGNMLTWAHDDTCHLVYMTDITDTVFSYADQDPVSCYRVRAVNSVGQVGLMSDVMAVQTKDDDNFGMYRLDYQDAPPVRDAFYDDLPDVGIERPSTPGTGEALTVRAWPNPFNPAVKISYVVPRTSYGVKTPIRFAIYNINGKMVEQMTPYDERSTRYEFTWNAAGHASGIYIARVQLDGKYMTKQLVLMK